MFETGDSGIGETVPVEGAAYSSIIIQLDRLAITYQYATAFQVKSLKRRFGLKKASVNPFNGFTEAFLAVA